MMNNRFVIIIIIAAIITAAALFNFRSKAPPPDTTEQARPVTAQVATLQSLAPGIPVLVRVTTPQLARIKSSVTADVTGLLKLEGESAVSEEVLIQLDDREAKLLLNQREADILEVQAQIAEEHHRHRNDLFVIDNTRQDNRLAKHNRKQVIREHEIRLSRLQASLKRVRAAAGLARLDVERTQVKAPFNGRISELHVSIGDRVRPGDALINIYNTDALELRGPLPDRLLATLPKQHLRDVGLKAQARLDGIALSATLDRIDANIDEASGAVDAIFTLDNDNAALPLGRSLRLMLTLPAISDAIALPPEAIYNNNRAYRIIDNRLQAIPVRPFGDVRLTNGNTGIVVKSPVLKEGDLIMTTQLPDAIENLLVNPVY